MHHKAVGAKSLRPSQLAQTQSRAVRSMNSSVWEKHQNQVFVFERDHSRSDCAAEELPVEDAW